MLRGQILSYLKTRKMISKGCVYHLVHVKDSSSEFPSLETVPVVNEYSDVFPKDLPGIPPEREIDLSIDLFFGYSTYFYFSIQNSTSRTQGTERSVEGSLR